MFNYLAYQPFRKPMAILFGMSTLLICWLSFITGRDIPPNALALLLGSNGIIQSWAFGTSSYEHMLDCKRGACDVTEQSREQSNKTKKK